MAEIMYAYAGRKTCGCVVEIMVDQPYMAKENAKRISKLIRDGLTVERVTVEQARQLFTICPHEKRKVR